MAFCIELLNRFGHVGIPPARLSPNSVTYELYAPFKTSIQPGDTVNMPLLLQFSKLEKPYYAEVKQRIGLAHCSKIYINESYENPGPSRPLAVSITNCSNQVYTFNRGKPVANLKLSEPWEDIFILCDENDEEKDDDQKTMNTVPDFEEDENKMIIDN